MMMMMMMMMQCQNMRRGPWDEDEDQQLVTFVNLFGSRRWDSIAKVSGLNRTGKSCRLRWLNYLRPNIKHGGITAEEEALILQLHARWGNKWSRIARRLPGRTDNEIKNYWRTHLKRRTQAHEVLQGCGTENDVHDSSTTTTTRGTCDLRKIPEEIVGSENGTADEMTGDMLSEAMKSPYESRLAEWIISEFSSDYQSDESENMGRFGYECEQTADLGDFTCCLWRMD